MFDVVGCCVCQNRSPLGQNDLYIHLNSTHSKQQQEEEKIVLVVGSLLVLAKFISHKVNTLWKFPILLKRKEGEGFV